jgi:ankyrin repeat protein
LLISAGGAKVNEDAGLLGTALHAAAQFGHAEAVRVLLELGADRTARNTQGKTAAVLASENKHVAAVALLKGDKCTVM